MFILKMECTCLFTYQNILILLLFIFFQSYDAFILNPLYKFFTLLSFFKEFQCTMFLLGDCKDINIITISWLIYSVKTFTKPFLNSWQICLMRSLKTVIYIYKANNNPCPSFFWFFLILTYIKKSLQLPTYLSTSRSSYRIHMGR